MSWVCSDLKQAEYRIEKMRASSNPPGCGVSISLFRWYASFGDALSCFSILIGFPDGVLKHPTLGFRRLDLTNYDRVDNVVAGMHNQQRFETQRSQIRRDDDLKKSTLAMAVPGIQHGIEVK